MSVICDKPDCINNPENNDIEFDPNGELTICDKCYAEEIATLSVDELMEIHAVLTNLLDKAEIVEDILALPFATEDIIDELMASDDVRAVADSIKDKWTDRFNVMLQYRLGKDYG